MCILCSDLLLHQRAAFVCLLLVDLVDLVPLSLVETLQPGAESTRHMSPGRRAPSGAELPAFRGPYLFSSCTSSSSCCPCRDFTAASKLTHISSFSLCSRLQHCVDVTEGRREGFIGFDIGNYWSSLQIRLGLSIYTMNMTQEQHSHLYRQLQLF